MFKKAYEGHYAIGAFNINNMEIVQGVTQAAAELNSPIILQASAGARKYAKPPYLKHLVEAALEDHDLPIALHLDHGADFETCKDCIDARYNSRNSRRNVPECPFVPDSCRARCWLSDSRRHTSQPHPLLEYSVVAAYVPSRLHRFLPGYT